MTFDFVDVDVPAGTYSFSVSGAGGRGGTGCTQSAFQGRWYFRNDVEGEFALATIPFRLTYAPIFPCVLQGSEDGTIAISCDSGDVELPSAICTVTPDDAGGYLLACADGTSVLISDGADGTDGAAGSSCSATDNGDAPLTVACDDGSSVVIRDGADAEPCAVESVEGGSKFTCPDGTSVFIADGVDGTDGTDGTDGADGSSCTVVSNEDGSATITCEDGTTATVAPGTDGTDGVDGVDGSSCSLTDNEDGTYTLTCEDGTEITLQDGAAGEPGADGEPGAAGEPGADGASGVAAAPCTVSQTAEGVQITCPDGTSALIPPSTLDDSGCSAAGSSPTRTGSFIALALGLLLARRRRA